MVGVCAMLPAASASVGVAHGENRTDATRDAVGSFALQLVTPKGSDAVEIERFIGISADFRACAVSTDGGLKVLDLRTGKPMASPMWDRDWGTPQSVAFGSNVLAVLAGKETYRRSLKLFSEKTGELEQNIRGALGSVGFCRDGSILAFTEFRNGGHYLVLRDVKQKKTVADVRIGDSGQTALAASAATVAAYESHRDQITLVNAETGAVVKKIAAGEFRKRKDSGRNRPALAVSARGELIVCNADDLVVLYDVKARDVSQKLEGHLDAISAVALAPDGKTVASAALDKTVRFWSVHGGKEVYIIKSLPRFPSGLVFSSDGTKIALVYGDRAEIRGLDAVNVAVKKRQAEHDAAAAREKAQRAEKAKHRRAMLAKQALADLRSPKLEDREEAIRLVTRIKEIGGQAAPLLVTLLADRECREDATNALAGIGKAAVPELIKGLGHKNVFVRLGSARALGRIGADANEAIASLKERARKDTSINVREAAQAAVRQITR